MQKKFAMPESHPGRQADLDPKQGLNYAASEQQANKAYYYGDDTQNFTVVGAYYHANNEANHRDRDGKPVEPSEHRDECHACDD